MPQSSTEVYPRTQQWPLCYLHGQFVRNSLDKSSGTMTKRGRLRTARLNTYSHTKHLAEPISNSHIAHPVHGKSLVYSKLTHRPPDDVIFEQQHEISNNVVCAISKASDQSDQSQCQSLEYSMSVKLLTEHHLEFLSLIGGCTGSFEYIHIKMPHCWKSHIAAHMYELYRRLSPGPCGYFLHNGQPMRTSPDNDDGGPILNADSVHVAFRLFMAPGPALLRHLK